MVPDSGSTGITGTTIDETWVLPQQLAQDLGYLSDAIVTNFPILKINSLKVNGVDYTDATYPQTIQPFINLETRLVLRPTDTGPDGTERAERKRLPESGKHGSRSGTR